VVAPVTVREKDLHTPLGIVSDDRPDLPPHGLPLSLLDDLMGQIRCDQVAFAHFDPAQKANQFGQAVRPDGPEDTEDDLRVFWDNYWDCDVCSYPDRSRDLRSVIKASDFYSARQWHSTGMYTDYFALGGIEHELGLTLPAGPGLATGPGQTVRLLFFRGPGPDFPSVTGRCWPCCARICTRPTSTRNAVVGAPRR
jgi:hypothetical protein